MKAQPSGGRLADRTIEGNAAGDGPGIETARLLAADRERIGHDLHDLVIRFLFDVSLKLHGALPLIEDHRAEQRVSDALGDIDQIIANVRLVVFAMMSDEPDRPGVGLRRRIVDVVDEIGQRTDQHPTLALDGPIDAVADARTADALVTGLRELLLGLARYAGVRSTRVGVAARSEPHPQLRVQLYGERSAGQAADEQPALRLWLEDVRERVNAGDGHLAAEVRPHAVTVSWAVPGPAQMAPSSP